MKLHLTEDQKVSRINAIISITATLLIVAGWAMICNSISYEPTTNENQHKIADDKFPIKPNIDTAQLPLIYTPVFYKEFKIR